MTKRQRTGKLEPHCAAREAGMPVEESSTGRRWERRMENEKSILLSRCVTRWNSPNRRQEILKSPVPLTNRDFHRDRKRSFSPEFSSLPSVAFPARGKKKRATKRKREREKRWWSEFTAFNIGKMKYEQSGERARSRHFVASINPFYCRGT